MIYNVTSDFIKLPVTSGTIQNNSRVYDVEISNQAVADSGILLSPLNKFSFSGTTLFIRCIEGGGWAEIRVVPFIMGGVAASSDTPTSTDTATDSDVDSLINDALNGNYTSDPETDSVIDDMLNNTDPIDTGDGFSDFVNELFP